MFIDLLIKDFKHIEKLNKTNILFKNYKSDFDNYILKPENIHIIFEKLSLKSSCLPCIIKTLGVSDKQTICELIKNLNHYILNNIDNIKQIINFLVNILTIPKIKHCF